MTKVNFFWKFHCFIKRINILHSHSWRRLYWKNIILPKVNSFFITRLWTYWCVAKFVNWWWCSAFCQSLLCDITSCSLFVSILVLSVYRLLFLYEYCLARIKLALSVKSTPPGRVKRRTHVRVWHKWTLKCHFRDCYVKKSSVGAQADSNEKSGSWDSRRCFLLSCNSLRFKNTEVN